MQRPSPIRSYRLYAAICCLAVCLPLSSQTPPAKPSAMVPATQPTAAQPPAAAPAALPQHHAEITYSNGKLTVSANNSSLNQILRDISHQTGMKITGGVTDERVFGQYGPAAPSSILATLLDGTSSNMLLVSTPGHDSTPTELILTPRHGGPTPPNPNAIVAEQRDQEEQEKEREQIERQEAAHPAPQTPQPPAEQPAPAPGTPATPAAASTDPSATDQQSPNGTKTPQQIFEQLQKMRQQPAQSATPQ